jgi:hypothetical protein
MLFTALSLQPACPAELIGPPCALFAVSGKFIDEFKMACSEEDRSQLKLMMGHVHVYVTAACKEYFDKFRRHVYVTPKSYLSFIQGYKELYSRKWAYTQELAASIQVSGLANTHVWFLKGLWAGGTTDDEMPGWRHNRWLHLCQTPCVAVGFIMLIFAWQAY